MAINGEIEGLDALFEKLDGLGASVKDMARAGLQKAAGLIKEEAKGRAPSDTGQLRNSIQCRTQVTDEGVEASITAGAEYAAYVEFGTGPKGQKLDPAFGPRNPNDEVSHRPTGWVYYDVRRGQFAYTEGQPARPFMYPAFLAQREAAKQAVEDELLKGIDALSRDT